MNTGTDAPVTNEEEEEEEGEGEEMWNRYARKGSLHVHVVRHRAGKT